MPPMTVVLCDCTGKILVFTCVGTDLFPPPGGSGVLCVLFLFNSSLIPHNGSDCKRLSLV